jgi:hypothetical protein
MIADIVSCLTLLYRFRGYEPQAITPATLYRWLRQFNRVDRPTALLLLKHVNYFNKQRVINVLLDQNAALHEKLATEGITPDRMVYVHIDEPGSSSSLMLNLLRNRANLERLACKFIDASNPSALEALLKREVKMSR